MQSGQIIAAKYRLNQPIGAGGMASVWSATNVFTERQLAIKFMSATVSRNAEAARRFLNEAKVSARVNHPNIIDVLDVGQAEDGSFFLVMELLTGINLETAIRRQSPPMMVHEFVGIMLDVARALTAAHKAGVVHRDLKPTNIFLHMIRESIAVPKLLDFGVSKFLEEEQNHALTIAGTVLGSPLYMSPEQAMGAEGIDGRTDVFAFGSILFEGLAGQRPYEATNFNALIVTIATKPPRSIDEYAPNMPEALRTLVRDCLVTDLKKRIQTFEEVVDRLLSILPELEQSGLRLPPYKGTADPDATTALPVVRHSDRPAPDAAPAGVHLSKPPSVPPPGNAPQQGAGPPAAFGMPWNGGDPNAITVRRPPNAWMFMASGAAGAFTLVGLVLWIVRGCSHDSTGPIVASASVTAAQTSAPPAAQDEPPVISVESLPVATSKTATPTARGMGRVSIAASPGWCNVAIDGVSRGATPVGEVELTAGTHRLVCAPQNGRSKTMTIVVVEGTTNKFKIALE
jgi:serine/threonine protein kinase